TSTTNLYSGKQALVRGWSPDQRILYASSKSAAFDDQLQLFLLDTKTGESSPIPLAQASDGTYDPTGKTLFFVRQPDDPSYPRGYRGGAALNIWQFSKGKEATGITTDFPGNSKHPMIWQDRLYFVSDRGDNQVQNLWSVSIAQDGKKGTNLQQHTHEDQFDLFSPSLHNGAIAYQSGADIVVHDLNTGKSSRPDIRLASDFEQRRPYPVGDPMKYLSSADLSDDLQQLAMVARGKLTTLPTGKGRIKHYDTWDSNLFFQTARFIPGSRDLLVLAEQGKSQSFWRVPETPGAKPRLLHQTRESVESGPVLSPDGTMVAWSDARRSLFITQLANRKTREIYQEARGSSAPKEMAWSPDSQWLVFARESDNQNAQLLITHLQKGTIEPITSERVHSSNPTWVASGDWLVFNSSRYYHSKVLHSFEKNQQEPYSDTNTGIFALAMNPNAQWPYTEPNELLQPEEGRGNEEEKEEQAANVSIELKNLDRRLYRIPLPAGNYTDTRIADGHLVWMEPVSAQSQDIYRLQALPIGDREAQPQTLVSNVRHYQTTRNREELLVLRGEQLYLIPVSLTSDNIDAFQIDSDPWQLNVNPVDEWHQILNQTWKYYNNHFYDKGMHQLDWSARLEQFRPLVNRVADRSELNHVMQQMLNVLGTMHLYLGGGVERYNPIWQETSWLGAVLTRQDKGYRIDRIYRSDPSYPEERSPLARPTVKIREGDVLTAINNHSLAENRPEVLLLDQAGQQVLLEYQRPGEKTSRKEIVYPDSDQRNSELRYQDWLFTRQERVEKTGKGKIGYVHLRGMESDDFSNWVRQFYPVYRREGLILDLRYNTGGSIDSWILSRLMRKAYSFESIRNQTHHWIMQYAFQGHLLVLVNEHTFSSGEMLTDGIRALKLGPIMGQRTKGGHVWLSMMPLIDQGFLSVPMAGHFFKNRQWASESIGTEPDIPVDNLPHATYQGKDTQLDTAIHKLLETIAREPVQLPAPPQGPITNH
ncbi:MAG: S41 family peptidase, partial [Endozoicomonas sp.]